MIVGEWPKIEGERPGVVVVRTLMRVCVVRILKRVWIALIRGLDPGKWVGLYGRSAGQRLY